MNLGFEIGLIVVAAIVLFVGIWLGVMYLLWSMGWRGLSRWRNTAEPVGTTFPWSTAVVGVVNYRSSLNVWVNDDGFWLKPVKIFALFHETLFIPWRDVKSVMPRRYWGIYTVASVKLLACHTQLEFWGAPGADLATVWSARNSMLETTSALE